MYPKGILLLQLLVVSGIPDDEELYEALCNVKVGTDVALGLLRQEPRHSQLADIENVIIVLEHCQSQLGTLQNQFSPEDLQNDVSTEVFRALVETSTHTSHRLEGLRDRLNIIQSQRYNIRTISTGNSGRPAYDVSREGLQAFRDLGFTWTRIAQSLGVSERTIRRRAVLYQLRDPYSEVNDAELDNMIRNLRQQTPRNIGIGMIEGHLRAQGIIMRRSRDRIWHSLRRLDPVGTSLRWNTAIRRRVYSVPGPGSLWHLDANLKLRRWGISIIGAIDGYSRLITILEAEDNLRAQTVAQHFMDAVTEYHWPSRLRTDRGGENTIVGRLIEEYRGEGRGSWMQGRSVHNQRIERLWRDVRTFCTQVYIDHFHQLESAGVIDIDNVGDICALHYVYLPLLNNSLKRFRHAHNNHKVRTMGYRTPLQVYLCGVLERVNSNHTHIRDMVGHQAEIHNANNSELSETERMDLADISIPADHHSEMMRHIRQLVPNPGTDTDDFGLERYIIVRGCVRNYLRDFME